MVFAGLGSVITKDPHTYWMRILRQEKSLHENARLRRRKYHHKSDIS
jgi:hypothetical protein